MLDCALLGLGIAGLNDGRTQGPPLTAAVDERSNAEAEKRTIQRCRTAPTADRAELNHLYIVT